MHLSIASLLSSLLLLATAVSSSSLTITIPSSNILPNPNVLTAGTHATLTSLPSLSNDRPLTAPLSHSATFVFRNLPQKQKQKQQAQSHPNAKGESYLLDIRSAEYVFAPYRVDVSADGAVLGVWETFRGNPWDNRGTELFNAVVDAAAAPTDVGVIVDAKVLARRGFYEQRATFSPLSLLKNPMILLAVVALGFTFGMPKLMENMDPEMRAEFDKHSRSSPTTAAARSAITGGGGGGPANFDLAGWMAGTAPGPMGGAEAPAEVPSEAPAQGKGAATGRDRGGASRRRG